jgi:hypothetical protein
MSINGIDWFNFDCRVEKYRPEKLEDLVSHEDITSTSEYNSRWEPIPFFVMYWPSGISRDIHRRQSPSTLVVLRSSRNGKDIYYPCLFAQAVRPKLQIHGFGGESLYRSAMNFFFTLQNPILIYCRLAQCVWWSWYWSGARANQKLC